MGDVQGTLKKADKLVLGIKDVFENTGAMIIMACFALAYVVIGILVLPAWFPVTSVNFILGMIGLPVTILYAPAMQSSHRFFPVALGFSILSIVLPEKTVLFLALAASAICLFEQVAQKLSLVSLLTLSFMSSTVQYLAGVFSFPLRLSLTHAAARMLNLTGTPSVCEGNVILFGQREYSVDPACMGLKMLLTSLLCGLFLVAILQKKQGRYLGWQGVLLSLSAIFILNMIANVFRILMLVYFDIRPDNTMHELVGLLCFAVYVLIPGLMVTKLFINKFGRQPAVKVANQPTSISLKKLLAAHILLLVALCSSVGLKETGEKEGTGKLPVIAGYDAAWYNAEVMRYSDVQSLIYIKKINGVLGGEHNPVTCWLGLGYEFERMNETPAGGTSVYTGVLKKGKERLYTAWWYDNGSSRSTSFFGWRWHVLKGEKLYAIINVTTSDQVQLNEKVKEFIERNTFKNALIN